MLCLLVLPCFFELTVVVVLKVYYLAVYAGDHQGGLSVFCIQNSVGRLVFCFLSGLLQSVNPVLPAGKAPQVPLQCKDKYTSNRHPSYHLGRPIEGWP